MPVIAHTDQALDGSRRGAAIDSSSVQAAFPTAPGYLNAATLGLPPLATTAALQQAVKEWGAGRADLATYDHAVQRCRELFAALVSVPISTVAIGAQVAVTAAQVAASLPDRAQVVCVDGDFSSMVFPFLAQADRGVSVRHVPLSGLPETVAEGCDLVAYSLAQSADGHVADVAGVNEAAGRVGALTFCDTTQAVGWYDVNAADHDITVCSAYKWLCSPRGSTLATFSDRAREALRPITANWYAGQAVWESCYGPHMQLAADARRFDLSPAWLSWIGTVPSLELFAALPVQYARQHGADLADTLRRALDMPPQGRPVVALDDPDGRRADLLAEAGCTVAGRAGRVRIAFHLWNDETDVHMVVRALRGARSHAH
ncbi:MAG: aminotransferase class V-fold PLP-dependent enzyme [Angustibacter sp.]